MAVRVGVSRMEIPRAVKAQFEATGNTPAITQSPQAFATFVRSENRKWAEIVKLTGVTAN